MLRLENVDAYYNGTQVLQGISLEVREGEIVALLGANGAGKSTTLKVVSGQLPARRGRVIFGEKPIDGLPSEKVVRLGISHVPEGRRLFGSLSVLDNLRLGAYRRYGQASREEIQSDLDFVFKIFPILSERRNQAAGTLSGGEQQMLAIGRGLMAKPEMLLLDEPSLGLAPMLVKEIFRVIASLREEGVTILLVEQNVKAALEIADRGYVLERGRVTLEGTAAELLDNGKVRNAYLGKGYGYNMRRIRRNGDS
ncbi:MAG: ABC transporter ATP-binding protein [Anaerolineae bacterium]